jgi:hypothetical protein
MSYYSQLTRSNIVDNQEGITSEQHVFNDEQQQRVDVNVPIYIQQQSQMSQSGIIIHHDEAYCKL